MAKGEKRSAARLAAVQALYQMDVAGKGVTDVMAEFEAFWIGQEVDDVGFLPAEEAFFRSILNGVVTHQIAIDRAIDSALADGWPLKRIETVLRAILRAGTFEIMQRKDIPAKVAIVEYVDVAKAFYESDEAGLVNAVLDRIARTRRDGELDARAG